MKLDAYEYGRVIDEDGQVTLHLQGAWRLATLNAAAQWLRAVPAAQRMSGRDLTSLDTAAAALLLRYRADATSVDYIDFSDSHRRVLDLVRSRLAQAGVAPMPLSRAWLGRVGLSAMQLFALLRGHVTFLGQVTAAGLSLLGRPQALRWRETAAQLQQAGLNAIPVVLLVTFLIGVVFAYLLGLQAQQYGANLYVVDGVAIGMARELSPIIVATIVAGRSGAAFTAQLGTMRLTEETDAIRTLGLSPTYLLVMPRVTALVLALPLLVFLGTVASLGGALAVCATMLDVTPLTFIERVHLGLDLDHVYAGLMKAPVFALAIAVIGCRMGMQVSRDTRSIGMSTTSTVVQSIVAVILLDAAFAVFFEEIDF